jgi:hypothetical protein
MIGIHSPSGATASPTLISPRRYAWLYAAHSAMYPERDFMPDLHELMLRYHPKSEQRNPQGRKLKSKNQFASPPPLQRALERTFLTQTELFAIPLNCSMSQDITYCTAFREDTAFGAIHDSYSYR